MLAKNIYDDLWKQVNRTINGKPVSQDQIDLIIDDVKKELNFSISDVLLDIGCANGALSHYFFDSISSFHGIDLEESLIEVANKYFGRPPNFTFECGDVFSYIKKEKMPERFTRCLCYGTLQFFPQEKIETFFKTIFERFVNISILYVGNMPDRDRAHLFYHKGIDFSSKLDGDSLIGIWRRQDDLMKIARSTGWDVKCKIMQKEYHASHYRFDGVFRRKK